MLSINFNSNVVKKFFYNTNAVKKLFLNGAMVWQDAVLPVGIIIGYTGVEAPSGWEVFSNANDKLIVGAGDVYNPGSYGGTNSVSKTLSTTTAGSHTGTSFYSTYGAVGTGGGTVTAGSHSHTISVSGVFNPLRHRIGFIKALEDSNIPINGIIFSTADLSNEIDVTNINTESAFLSSHSLERTLTGSDSLTLTGTSNSTGSHTHHNNGYSSGSDFRNITYASGAHTHSVSIALTPKIKSKYITTWSNALNEISICPNMIGMWEGNIPPEGWAICDGTNGTPDLVNYFIRLGNKNIAGSIHSDTNITDIPATNLPSSGSHNHQSSTYKPMNNPLNINAYHSDNITHSHTTVADTLTVEPSYYALTFIMKLP